LNIAIIINPGYWVDNTMFYEDQFETNDPSSLYELENINTTITGSVLGYNLGDDYQMTLPVNDNGTTRLETYAGKVVDNFNYAIPGVPNEATMIFGNRTIDYHKLGDFRVTAYLNYRDTVSEGERYAFVNILEQNDFDVDRGFVLSDSENHAQLKEDAKITGITNLLFPVFVIFLSFILISMDNLNLGKVVKLLNEKGWTKKELQKNFLMFSMLFFSIDLMLLSFASIAAVYANLYTNLGNSYYPMPSASEIFFSQYFWIVLVNTAIIQIVYIYKLQTNLRRLK
jgi:hypothetical protein